MTQYHQMDQNLVDKLKNTVDRFNISTETYYHAIMLFNIIQLKKQQHSQPEYFTIPIKKRSMQWSDDSDQDMQNYQYKQPETQYIEVHNSQMPKKDILELTVCLFLVHKLYQPYPVCLQYMMRHLQIEQRYEEYLLSLEKEFLVKLAYKIENMLPSNQTLFACSLWDQFVENISQSCIDIRFDINSLLCSLNKQIKTSHAIQTTQRQPQFKNIKNQKSFQALCHNIQILVHNRGLYELYLKKSLNQNHEDLPHMKRIGIVIVYVTILQSTDFIFNRRYGTKLGESAYLLQKRHNTNYIDFAFNDFLQQNYGLHLNSLRQQIDIISGILHRTNLKIQKIKNEKIRSSHNIVQNQVSRQNQLVKLLLGKKKQFNYQYHRKYHQKHLRNNERNVSISSTKTDQQKFQLCSLQMSSKNKCYSIVQKQSIQNKKYRNLQSTIHQSNVSEKGQSRNESIQKYQVKQFEIGEIKKRKIINDIRKENSFNQANYFNQGQKKYHNNFNQHIEILSVGKSTKSPYLKSSKQRHGKSLRNSNPYSKNHKKISQQTYKISQFMALDV